MRTTVYSRSQDISVIGYLCSLGPQDAPVEERHHCHSLSYVRRGSFAYSIHKQKADLVPGSVLIGYPEAVYSCSHEHHDKGDFCLSFQFSPQMAEEAAGGTEAWKTGWLPPLADIMVLAAKAEAAIGGGNEIGLDEAGLMLAARMGEAARGEKTRSAPASLGERKRIVETALWIRDHSHRDVGLEQFAAVAGLSPFHFLRLFAKVLGVTPHQYLIRSRLRHAARLLTGDGQPITDICFDCGFSDLSNFVRSFRAAAGASPSEFRTAARQDRKFCQVVTPSSA